MPIWLWIALAAFVVLLVATGSIAAVRAAKAWRAAHAIGPALATAVVELDSDVDTLRLIADELRAVQAEVGTFFSFAPAK